MPAPTHPRDADRGPTMALPGRSHLLARAAVTLLSGLLALAVASCDSPTASEPAPVEAAPNESRLETTAASDGLDITAWLPFELDVALGGVIALSHGAGAHDRMLDLMEGAHDGGTSGFYLREIGGPVHLAENETSVFEPASTIKALVHFHAMRQVQDGAVIDGGVVTLARLIQNGWATPAGSSCPLPATAFSASLQTGLTAMMVPSDNPWTQALRDFFGDANIDATRQTFLVNNSILQHLIGCAADAVAQPNRLTLVDAGRMYEAVATGFLTPPTLDDAYDIMDSDGALFNAMIDDESADLGLTADAIAAFKAGRRSALKGGSYNFLIDGNSIFHRSVAGWATLPFKDATCVVSPREFVYGAFIQAADAVMGLGIRALGVETFREQVRHALEAWAACEADLEMLSVETIGLPDPLNVNQAYDFTVRATFINNGPAAMVDVAIDFDTDIGLPEDCTIAPALATHLVDDLALDSETTADLEVTLTCSAPSDHGFFVRGAISPQNPEVVDPVVNIP